MLLNIRALAENTYTEIELSSHLSFTSSAQRQTNRHGMGVSTVSSETSTNLRMDGSVVRNRGHESVIVIGSAV
jgi:hypothetical protein